MVQWFFSLDDGVFREVIWYMFCQYLVVVCFVEMCNYGSKVVMQWVGVGIVDYNVWQYYDKWVVINGRLCI